MDQPSGLADQAARSADNAIRATQRVTNETLDSLSGSVHDLRQQAAPLLDRAAEQVSALARRGVDSVRDTSQQLRDQALRATDGTVNYIRDEPVKAMLIAAASGALLMALIRMIGNSRHH